MNKSLLQGTFCLMLHTLLCSHVSALRDLLPDASHNHIHNELSSHRNPGGGVTHIPSCSHLHAVLSLRWLVR